MQLYKIGTAARWMAFSFFLWGIGEGLWIYIQALYPERLGATPQQTGLVLSMVGVGRLMAILPFTLALDHYNPRTVMFPGYLSGVVGMLLLAIAPSWQFSMLGFLVFGFSAPTLIPTSVYLSDTVKHDPTTQLHTVLTFTWAANAAGIILSPALGGWIGEHFSLRLVFALSAFWFALSMLVVYFCPTFPTQKVQTISPENKLLLREKGFLGRNALFALIFFTPQLGYVLVPRFLEEVHSYSVDTLGLMGVMSALGIALTNLLLGQTQAWRGFLIGQALTCVALFIFLASHAHVMVALAYGLYGAWYSFRPFTTSLITEIVPTAQHGFAFAIIDILYAITSILAPMLAGLLYAQQTALPLLVSLLATLLTLGLTFGLVIRRNMADRYAYIKQQTIEIRKNWIWEMTEVD